MKAPHDMWRFNKDGAKLFKAGEDIPAGYVDSPAKVAKGDDTPKRRGRPPKVRKDD